MKQHWKPQHGPLSTWLQSCLCRKPNPSLIVTRVPAEPASSALPAPRPQLWAAVCRGPHGPPPLGKPFSGLRLALLAEGTPEVQSHLLPRGRGTGGGTAKGWVWAEGQNSRGAGNPPPPRPSQPVRRFEKFIPQVYRGSHMQHLLIGPMSRCTRPSVFLKAAARVGMVAPGGRAGGRGGMAFQMGFTSRFGLRRVLAAR